MSYSNGLGSVQQSYSSADVEGTSAAAKPSGATPAADKGKASEASAAAADHTSLSATGNLVAQALSGSDVRADKVAALQQQIAAGTYNVPASAVADKLIGALLR